MISQWQIQKLKMHYLLCWFLCPIVAPVSDWLWNIVTFAVEHITAIHLYSKGFFLQKLLQLYNILQFQCTSPQTQLPWKQKSIVSRSLDACSIIQVSKSQKGEHLPKHPGEDKGKKGKEKPLLCTTFISRFFSHTFAPALLNS